MEQNTMETICILSRCFPRLSVRNEINEIIDCQKQVPRMATEDPPDQKYKPPPFIDRRGAVRSGLVWGVGRRRVYKLGGGADTLYVNLSDVPN